MKNILYIIIAIALTACGRGGNNNESFPATKSMTNPETASPNSTACTSKADYEFGVKNGLTMAPPCEGAAGATKVYALDINFISCEKWLSGDNSSQYKVLLKNNSSSKIYLWGKISYRNASNQEIDTTTIAKTIDPGLEIVDQFTLFKNRCGDVDNIIMSEVTQLSTVDGNNLSKLEAENLLRNIKINFQKGNEAKLEKTASSADGPTMTFESESDITFKLGLLGQFDAMFAKKLATSVGQKINIKNLGITGYSDSGWLKGEELWLNTDDSMGRMSTITCIVSNSKGDEFMKRKTHNISNVNGRIKEYSKEFGLLIKPCDATFLY